MSDVTYPRRAVVTLASWGGQQQGFIGAVALDPESSGIREVGRLAYSGAEPSCGPSPELRTRVIGDELLLFTPHGVQAASINDLSPRQSLTYEGTSSDAACQYGEPSMAPD